MNWSDYVIAICTIVSTTATVLGALFVVIQIRNGTRAQQDLKAPLIVLEKQNNSIAAICLKNVGDFSATIVKISAKIYFNNNTCEKKTVTRQLVIDRGDSVELFSIREMATEKDNIIKVQVEVRYNSPLNDRTRKCTNEFVRR